MYPFHESSLGAGVELGSWTSAGFRRRDRNRFHVEIETDKSYVAHEPAPSHVTLRCVNSNSRSVTHELRIGAGRSIVTSGRGRPISAVADLLTSVP